MTTAFTVSDLSRKAARHHEVLFTVVADEVPICCAVHIARRLSNCDEALCDLGDLKHPTTLTPACTSFSREEDATETRVLKI